MRLAPMWVSMGLDGSGKDRAKIAKPPWLNGVLVSGGKACTNEGGGCGTMGSWTVVTTPTSTWLGRCALMTSWVAVATTRSI